MRMSWLVMVAAAACFAAGSSIEAQGRGHGPAGHGPQLAPVGSSNVGAGNTGGGKNGKAGSPGESGQGRGNPGTTPGHTGDRGKNVGSGGHGKAREEHGNGGKHPGDAGEGRDRVSVVAKMNPQQRARLESMLPSGMTLEQAADGFRNRGQFIAALQQSRNHDISFGDLKAQMTGDNPISLGEAMRKLGVATEEDRTPARASEPADR